jgi:hypothetical protein
MVIPFTYNILKRHPALMVMIHRVDDETEESGRLPSFPSQVLLRLNFFFPFERRPFPGRGEKSNADTSVG